MRVGIDASNLRTGGGVTHLVQLLTHAEPKKAGVTEVIVWGNQSLVNQLPRAPWLRSIHEPMLDGALPSRMIWHRRRLPWLAREQCDVVFSPGGLTAGAFRPSVAMCRNMLPFSRSEMWRYAYGYIFFRLQLLHLVQLRSFRSADGLIFLNHYVQKVIETMLPRHRSSAVIPHGVAAEFRCAPRLSLPPTSYSALRPFRLVYTSTIDLYKHQWNVAEAVLRLCGEGLPIELTLIGAAYPPAMRRLKATINRFPNHRDRIVIRGAVPHSDLAGIYRNADAFVLASTCENMPHVLIEAMASGLPIACSDREPMPSVLKDGGVYFDPESVTSAMSAIRRLWEDGRLRERIAKRAFELSSEYSWTRCAEETFAFLAHVARESKENASR